MKCINLKYSLVAMWIKVLLDTARTSPLYGYQLCFSSMNISALTRDDKGLLVSRPVTLRLSGEHVGLGLT